MPLGDFLVCKEAIMPRARNIKPSFFTNEMLAEVSPLARLLFIGLWTVADRRGRLEDRPKKIKAEVLPYDNCDPEKLLNELASKGFITRYEVNTCGYICIPKFEKHQNPHCKESESTIPAPDEPGASTVQVSEIPERARLIPDSGFLIPESPLGSMASVESILPELRTEFIFKLAGKNSWMLSSVKLSEYQANFPGVKIDIELRKAMQWISDNPSKRKTENGMPRFLSSWLSKVQDSNRGLPLFAQDPKRQPLEVRPERCFK